MSSRPAWAGRAAHRAPAVALAGLALACGGPAGDTAPARPPAPRPNVLLIVVDTLRADRLGTYGFAEDTSPQIDRLAAEGVRFERYRTAAPSTLASFTSLLTSRYPHAHGVYRNGVAWPRGLVSLQSVLGVAGYTTAAFVASYCLSAEFGLSRGFDHFDDRLTTVMEDLPQNKLIRRAEEVTAAVRSWLAERDSGAPFFAMVHYFDPHFPYQPPAPYDTWFDPEYRGAADGSMAALARARARLARDGGRPDADSLHLHALHLGEIRYTDAQIGLLLESLERSGLGRRTLVILTADHGETFHEHADYFSHGATVYDTAIAIPLIVSGPGVAGGGRVVRRSAVNIDLAPTLLEFLDLPIPEEFQGRSFVADWVDPAATLDDGDRAVFAEATGPHHVERGELWPNRRKTRGVVRGGFKWIRSPWRGDRTELYDLQRDPGEQRNLVGARHAEAVARSLAGELRRWDSIEPRAAGEPPEADPKLDERLRALGYVD